MKTVTARGIYNDLTASTYRVKIDSIEYFFSSKNYMDKFLFRRLDNYKKYSGRLEKFLLMENRLEEITDILLYTEVETRGFFIKKDGVPVCLENLTFVGKVERRKN